MKKKIYFIMILTIIFFSLQCSVNEQTGLIQVYNYTNTPLKDVKIGNTLITGYVAPGNTVDYWYIFEINGKLQTNGVPPNQVYDNLEFSFKTNYWIKIIARSYGSGGGSTTESVVVTYTKNGTKYNEESLVK